MVMRADQTSERALRQAICETARVIWSRGLGAAADGNLSVRLGSNRIITTPSGCHKGRLTPQQLAMTDLSGKVLSRAKPSSELALHLAAYAERPDVHAVIHAHPPMATAYELAGGALSEVFVSEVIFAFGQVATAPYVTPTTADVGRVLAPYLKCYDVVMMPRHGVVTLGEDLDQAFIRLDAMEHTARIVTFAQLLGARFQGSPKPLPDDEVQRLYSAAGRNPSSAPCPPLERKSSDEERLVAAVLDELKRGSMS
ncbi:MAG TPA: class II aldolase family protein [Myxococcales bacterium]|nr:aldolase [Myxococcales bacterium]HAN32057.1 class II aldolase family protein [Myxococcales bacterium]